MIGEVGGCAATMPPLETTAGLRICWALLNWSIMVLPFVALDYSCKFGACWHGVPASNFLSGLD
jgi:hypothetical protein